MNRTTPVPFSPLYDATAERGAGHPDAGALWRALRRASAGLMVWVLICAGAGLIYRSLSTREYTASTLILLLGHPAQIGAPDQRGALPPTLDPAVAESQLQLVKSQVVLRKTYAEMNLASLPEFGASPESSTQRSPIPPADPQTSQSRPGEPNLAHRIMTVLLGAHTAETAPEPDAGFQRFVARANVRRVGLSYVLEVLFTYPDRRMAAKIANSISAAYILDQIRVRADPNGEHAESFQRRLDAVEEERALALQAVRDGVTANLNIPDADARIISSALAPAATSGPGGALVVVFSLSFGLLSGLLVVLAMHGLDRRIRSGEQISTALDSPCQCELPRLSKKKASEKYNNPPRRLSEYGPYSEGLRALCARLRGLNSSRHKVIGVTSTLTGEGKSMIALDLALLLAGSGQLVTLVDANMKSRKLTKTLAPSATAGLFEYLVTDFTPDLVPLLENLSLLPAASGSSSYNPCLSLASHEMRQLIEKERERGFVVVDMPALRDSADAEAVAAIVDCVIFLVEADRTTVDEARSAMARLSLDASNVMLVLNKGRKP